MRCLVAVVVFSACVPLAAAQTAKKEKSVVVVDASRDGGAWWFPQTPKMEDPGKAHQGKALADSLKKQGWDVIEIPRNATATEKLAGAKVVLRVGHVGPAYTKEEIAAYRDFVKEGGTLVLFSGSVAKAAKPTPDPIAAEFGFAFGDTVKGTTATWTNDPLVKGLQAPPFIVGEKITKMPDGAVVLAKLNPDLVEPDLVAAVVKVEKGRVFAFSSSHIAITNHASSKLWFDEPKK